MNEAPSRPTADPGASNAGRKAASGALGQLRALGEPLARVQRSVASILADRGIRSAPVDARWLVEAVDGRDPLRHPGSTFTGDAARLERLVRQRAARQPLQLILGTTNFMGHELRCVPGVFVPRPETEVLASLAIEAARGVIDRGELPRVVEVCTGTGAVARALLGAVAPIELVAADVDPRAVALASDNLDAAPRPGRDRPGVRCADRRRSGSVRVVRSDLLAGVEAGWRGTLDLLVANPPYLPAADHVELEPEVRDHDPFHALVGGPDGDEIVRRLVTDAVVWLRAGGQLLVEIDARAADAAATAAAVAGLTGIEVHDDLTGRPRVLVARRDGEGRGGEAGAGAAPVEDSDREVHG